MAAHGVGGGLGGEGRGGDVVSRVEAAAILELGARGDLDDGGDAGEAELAGEAPVAAEPIDLSGEGDAALLDPAVAFVVIGDAVEAGGRRVGEEGFDLGAERRLVGLDREQVVGPGVDDGGGDGRIAGDGIDGDDGALQRAALGEALEQDRNGARLVRRLLDRFLAEDEPAGRWRRPRRDGAGPSRRCDYGCDARSCRRSRSARAARARPREPRR